MRAFEAMLSASAARTRALQAPLPAPTGAVANTMAPSVSQTTKEPEAAPAPLLRPGRVLDIKV